MTNRCFLAFLLSLSLFAAGPTAASKSTSKTSDTTTPAKPEKPKILFLDLTCTAVKPEVVETISDLVGAHLGEYKKYDVITGQDLRQMAKLEVEKQKSGCVDNSCLAELAGAMGARYVVFGKVGKLAERTIITLNLFDSQEAKAVDRAVVSTPDIGSIPDLLPAAVAKLMGEQVVASSVIQPAVVATPAPQTPPQPEQVAPPVTSAAQSPLVVEEKVAVAQPAPPVVVKQEEPEGPKRKIPWMRVGSAGAVAVVGAGVAMLMGTPQYSVMTAAEDEYIQAATQEFLGSETTELKAAAKTEQATYMAGPIYWLWSGSTVAVLAGSYALWAYLTAPLVEEEKLEVTP